jgi:hypothetical protein
MDERKKIKYEKPVSIDAGSVASVYGARCSDGHSADIGTCSAGFDDNLQPLCRPVGQGSTGNCQNGNNAQITCLSGSAPQYGCYAGTGPAKISSRFG